MSYRDMESMPDGPCVSVLTRACNVRGCRLINGVPHYRSVHGKWFDARLEGDPPQKWWDGPIPGSKDGRYYYPEMLKDRARAALGDAPPAPVGEVVAWQWRHKTAITDKEFWSFDEVYHGVKSTMKRALYSHPPVGEVERLKEALKRFLTFANSVWFDEGDCTEEEYEEFYAARAALKETPHEQG